MDRFLDVTSMSDVRWLINVSSIVTVKLLPPTSDAGEHMAIQVRGLEEPIYVEMSLETLVSLLQRQDAVIRGG